ncbi:6640_t:CDS:2, partial [Cetraspora pellucida]
IVLQIKSQAMKICAQISYEHMKVQHIHQILLLEPLLHCVSIFVLNKICNEWVKASSATPDSPLDPCTGTFKSTMGLPCSHIISERLAKFLEPTPPVNNDYTDFQPLLQSLAQAYQFWPPHQQATI